MTIPGGAPALFFTAAAAGPAAGYAIDRSLRFNSADSAYLSRTPSSAGNRKTWTWSGWIKKTVQGSYQKFFSGGNTSDEHGFRFENTDQLSVYRYSGGMTFQVKTTRVFRDPSAFFHLIVAYDSSQGTASNRVKIYINGVQETDFATSNYPSQDSEYGINNTVEHGIGRLSGAPSSEYFNGYLADVQLVDGQALAPTDFGETDSSGIWQPKAYSGSYGTTGFHLKFADNSTDAALGTDSSGNSNTWTINNLSVGTPSYQTQITGTVSDNTTGNTGSAYNYLLFDGNNAVSTSVRPDGNETITWTPSSSYTSVTDLAFYTYYPSGNTALGTLFYVNGSLVTPTTKAQGGWTVLPVPSGGTVTSVGFGKNGSDYVYVSQIRINNVAITEVTSEDDSLVDTPEQRADQTDSGAGGTVVGNYATLNPLDVPSNLTLSNGNLELQSNSNAWKYARTTVEMSSGKYYCEFGPGLFSDSNNHCQPGVSPINSTSDLNTSGAAMYHYSGDKYVNGANSSYGSGWGANTIIGIAFDADTRQIEFFNNGVSQGVAGVLNTTTDGAYAFTLGAYGTWNQPVYVNFGQRPFAYAAPSGFKCLNTGSLPTPTIADGSLYFDALAYTGNGTNGRDVTGFSMSPDFVWIKGRTNMPDGYPYDHFLADTVRGAGKSLASNTSSSENSNDSYGYISQFNSDGFRVTAGSTQDYYVNETNEPYIAWAWDAASSDTSIAAGGLNSSVYDQSQTWSSNSSGLNNPSYLFENDSSNATHVSSANSSGDITFGSALTGVTKLEVKFAANPGGGMYIRINGQNITTEAGSGVNTFVDLTSALGGTTFSSIGATSGASGGPELWSVRVNGKLLVDSGVSVTNVPTIASTVRANPSAGFSICTYTGSTGNQSFAHGLNVAPKFILIKNRSNSATWFAMFDTGAAHYQYGHLDSTSAFAAATAQPVSNTTVTLGNNNAWFGANGDNYVAYCFAPVEGYSAFGSYTANGASDGPYVFTGMRPRWIMIKAATNSTYAAYNDWIIIDAARYAGNGLSGSALFASESFQEGTGGAGSASTVVWLDILSNGFKIRAGNTEVNYSGTYVYAAFAEHPFQNSRAR